MNHHISHVHRHAMLRVCSFQNDSDVYDGMRLNRRGSLRVLTLQEVLTVLVATCPPLGKVATRFRLSPHMPCQAAVASGPDGRRCFQQYHTKASRSESAEPNNVHDTRRQHTTQHRLPISLSVSIYIYIYITRVQVPGQARGRDGRCAPQKETGPRHSTFFPSRCAQERAGPRHSTLFPVRFSQFRRTFQLEAVDWWFSEN